MCLYYCNAFRSKLLHFFGWLHYTRQSSSWYPVSTWIYTYLYCSMKLNCLFYKLYMKRHTWHLGEGLMNTLIPLSHHTTNNAINYSYPELTLRIYQVRSKLSPSHVWLINKKKSDILFMKHSVYIKHDWVVCNKRNRVISVIFMENPLMMMIMLQKKDARDCLLFPTTIPGIHSLN